MKVGEHWVRNDGSIWEIIRLTRTTPERDSREEGVELTCIKADEPAESRNKEERLLETIFGNRFNAGDYEVYTRRIFLRYFSKVH